MTTPSQHETQFTIRMANRMLPLVKMIVQDIVALSKDVLETRERLERLSEGRETGSREDEYSRELNSIEQATERNSDKVDCYIQELTELQLSVREVTDGFVDFPATREGETVCLCWHLADKEVMYWHKRDEKCSVRRLVDLPLIRQSSDCQYSNLA